jgi:hypothetical protein
MRESNWDFRQPGWSKDFFVAAFIHFHSNGIFLGRIGRKWGKRVGEFQQRTKMLNKVSKMKIVSFLNVIW